VRHAGRRQPHPSASLKVSTRDGKVEITGPLTWEKDPASELHIEIPLAKFLEQIPFGAAFDQLLIVDDAGQLLGTAIGVQRGSPMLPPRGTVKSTALPMRVLDLGKLKLSGAGKDAPQTVKDLGDATLVQKVELGGTRYTLMCQPWRVNSTNGLKAWRLCGLVDGQRSFRQALEVAPQVVMLLLVLLMLALVSWPVLKILSLAPRERIASPTL
jgi:hypothetical protein